MRKSMNVKLLHTARSVQSTRSGLTQNKAFEGEPMQIRSPVVKRKFKSGDRPDLYAGIPPLEAVISIAANHKETFFSHAHRRVTCILSCKSSETYLCYNNHQWRTEWAPTWHTVRTKQWRARLDKNAWKIGSYQMGLSSKNLFRRERHQVSGMTHGDDFVARDRQND